jgi:DNA-binding MarR family transcriptional regulator
VSPPGAAKPARSARRPWPAGVKLAGQRAGRHGPGGPNRAVTDVDQLSSEDYENLLAFRTGLRRFLRWSEARAREVGLTPAQHQLLLAIKGHPGDDPPAVGDLAEYLLLRPHSTVELIDRAESAGLVERWGDDGDGRITRIRLTEDGAHRLDRLATAHLDELRRLTPILDQLTAQPAAQQPH